MESEEEEEDKERQETEDYIVIKKPETKQDFDDLWVEEDFIGLEDEEEGKTKKERFARVDIGSFSFSDFVQEHVLLTTNKRNIPRIRPQNFQSEKNVVGPAKVFVDRDRKWDQRTKYLEMLGRMTGESLV